MSAYRLSRRAKTDLDVIWDYSLGRWGLQQAAAYHRQIRDAIEMIGEEPHLTAPDDSLRSGYRRRLVGSHVIFYRLGGTVEIVRILHQNMDARAHLGWIS